MSTRRAAQREPSPAPSLGEGGEEEDLDLRQQVEQLQLRLNEAETELRVLRNLDNGTTRKRVSLAPGDLQPTPTAHNNGTDLG
eukprot:4198451-Pyramimonas_sp.AAC.1